MRGQCLIHLTDIVGTNLELNQAWALGDTCWPCAERTVALGITLMVDVTSLPENAFGYVPTPALVAPIEFTMRKDDYIALGGHVDHIMSIDDVLAGKVGPQNDHDLAGKRRFAQQPQNPWPIGR